MKPIALFDLKLLLLFVLLNSNSSIGQGIYFSLEVINYDNKLAIEDANVKIVGVDAQETDRNGKVVFRLEENKTFQVFVTKKGFKPIHSLIQTNLSSKAELLIEMHKVMDNSYFIRGRVLDQEGIRVPNLRIKLQIGSFQSEIYSDSISGYFLFEVPIEQSGKFPDGTIYFDFEDCPKIINFRSLPAGQNSEIIEIRKSCKRELRGKVIGPQKKIKGSRLYYRTAEPNLGSLKEIDAETGEFIIDSIEAKQKIHLFFEHYQYEKKRETVYVHLRQGKNYIEIRPDKLFLPKFPVKNNTPFYINSSICMLATIYGFERLISAGNLYGDYKGITDNDAFITERPEYENRDEAYIKLERIRRTSLIFLSAGILGGTIGYLTLYRSKKTRFDFSLAGEVAITYNIN